MSAPKTKTKYVSKGERRSIAKDVCKAVKRERSAIDYWTIKQKAWEKGQNPWIVVPNGNTSDTRAKFVRVRAETEWGDPRAYVKMKVSSE
jgi:uncharacterized protein YciW